MTLARKPSTAKRVRSEAARPTREESIRLLMEGNRCSREDAERRYAQAHQSGKTVVVGGKRITFI